MSPTAGGLHGERVGRDGRVRLGGKLGEQVWSSWPDTQRGLVSAEFTVATPELKAKAEQAFGPGVVELRSVLQEI